MVCSPSCEDGEIIYVILSAKWEYLHLIERSIVHVYKVWSRIQPQSVRKQERAIPQFWND